MKVLSVEELEQMSPAGRAAYFDLLLAQNFHAFTARSFQELQGKPLLANWHIQAMTYAMGEAIAGRIKRLVVTVPPRSLKSHCASIALPAFALGLCPQTKIICVSYAEDLALKFSRDCRNLMQTKFYRSIFSKVAIDKNSEREFTTTDGGYRMATSTGGTLTGRGGDIIVIDDPVKPDDAESISQLQRNLDWYGNTFISRLDSKLDGVIVVVMQRLHMDDLVGHVLKEGGWHQLNLPAIAEAESMVQIGPNVFHQRQIGDVLHSAREPEHVLEQIKASMGSRRFSAQYQQEPLPEDGGRIKWSWFQEYDGCPLFEAGDRIVLSWDTASKASELSDYSACVVLLARGDRAWVLEVIRKRLEFPALKHLIRQTYNRYGALGLPCETVIEDHGSGISLIQQLREDYFPVIAFTVKGADKVMRMDAVSSKIEGGGVYLPRRAAWLDDFKIEILQFPNGRNDDQVDALSQGLTRIFRKPRSILIGHVRGLG
jgi:predicted phage terminase large subunit-like protein